MVRMPVVYHELITFGVSVVLPIQLNWRTSYLTPAAPVAWCTAMFCDSATIAVPSLGATLASQLATSIWPAPGMLDGTIVGLPGMYLPIWRPPPRPRRAEAPPPAGPAPPGGGLPRGGEGAPRAGGGGAGGGAPAAGGA